MLIINYKTIDTNIALSRAVKFYSRFSIEESIKVVSIIYLLRYYKIVKEIPSKDLFNIFKACMVLAYKFLLDFEVESICNYYQNEMCKKLKWNLFINEEEYSFYSSKLSSSIDSKDSKWF